MLFYYIIILLLKGNYLSKYALLIRPLRMNFFYNIGGKRMKSSRIMRVFENYVKQYDMNNVNVKMRYFHSLKVMEIARDLAIKTGYFNEEEIVVCELIGLFHEIANFDSVNSYRVNEQFEDDSLKTIDVLFKQGLIKDITSNSNYNDIIKTSILSYNKDDLPTDIDSKTRVFCKIIKDAHRIDMFRIALNYPYFDMHIDNFPSAMVYDQFKLFRFINSKMTENDSDEVLAILSNVFALNLKYSYEILKESNYINGVIDMLYFNDKKIETFFKQIGSVLNSYINRKIGG